MKDDGPLQKQIGSAAEAVYSIYCGQCPTRITAEQCQFESGLPPEGLFTESERFFDERAYSVARGRRLHAFVGMQARRCLSPIFGEFIYQVMRRVDGSVKDALEDKKGPAWIGNIRDGLVKDALSLEFNGNQFGLIVRAIKRWRKFDDVELGGWVHEILEQLAEEFARLWPRIHVVALKLKNKGSSDSRELLELCKPIYCSAFELDPELSAIIKWHYQQRPHAGAGGKFFLDGVPFLELSAAETLAAPFSKIAVQLSQPRDVAEALRLNVDDLNDDSNPAVASGRAMLLLYNGNFFVHDGKLRAVIFPIDPKSGQWNFHEWDGSFHKCPGEYAQSATYALQFALAGFVAATHSLLRRLRVEGRLRRDFLDAAIRDFWVPEVLRQSFAVAAAPNLFLTGNALEYAASVYARLALIEGWLNPVVMRDKLRDIFFDTSALLNRFPQVCEDLEEALASDLIKSADDLIAFGSDVVDLRFEENADYGYVISYCRERAESYHRFPPL